MRKVTLAVAALTLLVAGFVLAQVTAIQSTAQKPGDFTIFQPPKEAAVHVEPLPVEEVQLSDKLMLRIEGEHDGRAVGTLMARVDGRWVEVILASKNMRAAIKPTVIR